MFIRKNQKTDYAHKGLKILPLGGCGEFGMNLTCYISEKRFMVVDAGSIFPEPKELGVSSLIPKTRALFKKLGQLLGYVITHGHEDHIGALPFLYLESPAPIYATAWTCELIKRKFKKYKIPYKDLHLVRCGQTVYLNPFSIEYLHVNHSIPDAASLFIKTQSANAFHTGDFKFDATPIAPDKVVDTRRFEEIRRLGIDVLLSDSTNSHREGNGPSEESVLKPLEELVAKAKGRVFITGFSSNFWRIKTVLSICKRQNRKLFIDGRGLNDSVDIAQNLGYLEKQQPLLISGRHFPSNPPQRLVVLLSGSQGEPRSSLVRMALGEHRSLRIKPGDTVIFSARSIPGNEKNIGKMTDILQKQGAHIITPKECPKIHVSGHAYRHELLKMIELLKPKYYVPVHGNYALLAENESIAYEASSKPRSLIIENGDMLEVSHRNVQKKKTDIILERYYIDADSNIPISSKVLNERLSIGEAGLVFVTGLFKKQTKKWIRGPFVDVSGLGSRFGSRDSIMESFSNDLHRNMAEELVETRSLTQENLNKLCKKLTGKIASSYYNKRPVVISKIFIL